MSRGEPVSAPQEEGHCGVEGLTRGNWGPMGRGPFWAGLVSSCSISLVFWCFLL